jgi:hypothetical protein
MSLDLAASRRCFDQRRRPWTSTGRSRPASTWIQPAAAPQGPSSLALLTPRRRFHFNHNHRKRAILHLHPRWYDSCHIDAFTNFVTADSNLSLFTALTLSPHTRRERRTAKHGRRAAGTGDGRRTDVAWGEDAPPRGHARARALRIRPGAAPGAGLTPWLVLGYYAHARALPLVTDGPATVTLPSLPLTATKRGPICHKDSAICY